MSAPAAPKPPAARLPVTVDKPTPYTFDLGLLLANDPNPVSAPRTGDAAVLEAHLASVARDGAQALVNQLLTTCAITPTAQDGLLLSLPAPQTPLPREKPAPTPKPETRWAAFARRRGIRPKTREQRRNLQYDERAGEWGRRWGYKGANKAGGGGQDEPIVELDARTEAERKEGTSVRGDKRREIRERVKRNERRMRRNQRMAERRT